MEYFFLFIFGNLQGYIGVFPCSERRLREEMWIAAILASHATNSRVRFQHQDVLCGVYGEVSSSCLDAVNSCADDEKVERFKI